MNYRISVAAAFAVIMASFSEYALISGADWLLASMGAVIVVMAAGILTRLAPPQAVIGSTILAAGASAPLLADRSILVKVAGLAIIGCCAASASRVRLFRPLADIVTYLAALLLYLNLTLAAGKSFLYVIPTMASVHHLVALAHAGTALARYSPPVPDSKGVVLLAAASIGYAAVVVDILAVRLHRPAIAGLPLLVIFMSPVATAAKPSGIATVLTFLLAAIGYLALLASDGRNRLRGWGRIVTVWHYSGEDERLGGADIRGLAATGRRIGFAAVCAAIVAPLLLPTLNLHQLFSAQGGHPNQAVAVLPNPVDQLHSLLSSTRTLPVLSYRAAGTDQGEYLQVYVLNYDAARGIWTLLPPSPSTAIGVTPLSQPPGLSPGINVTQTTTTIRLDNVAGSSTGYDSSLFFLPVPYFPITINFEASSGDSWEEANDSLMIFSGNGDHAGMSYSVTTGKPVVTAAAEHSSAQVPHAIKAAYLGFRSSVTRQLTTIARQITRSAGTKFAMAQALEKYFQAPGNFTYSLQALNLPNSAKGLLTFLTTGRKGSCEQFAFAMAVLARLVGIPSRVAIGFTSGTQAHQGGLWHVTTADAHAWPELYFPTLGWLRFEPTPGGANGQGSAVQPSYATPKSPGGSKPGNNHQQHGQPGPSSPSRRIGAGHLRVPASDPLPPQSTVPIPSAPAPVGQILLGVLVLLLLLATAPAAARIISTRRRWHSAVNDQALARAAWQEICADLADLGLTYRASETPRALAARLCADTDMDDRTQAAMRRISTVVERTRYALESPPATGIRTDVRQVRRALAGNVNFPARLRARLIPASTIGPILRRSRHWFGQLTGWVSTLPTEG